MNKHLLTFLLSLACTAQVALAQAPKWIDKAKSAVFSIVTYDANDKIIANGNGFFISTNGVAVSDYGLFKGAKRAVVITSDGQQLPVSAIMGANDLYDVVKFQVNASGKKLSALTVVATPPTEGSDIYLLPYSTQKDRSFTMGKLTGIDRAGDNNNYYTVGIPLADKMTSCPLVDQNGQVFGLAQKAAGADTATTCYAADARFAASLSINAFSINDRTLTTIGIRKALPDTEEQALAFLYIAASKVSADDYADLLDYFLEQYPNSADGYLNRANNRITRARSTADLDLVNTDIDQALRFTTKKDDTYYARARLIYAYLISPSAIDYPSWTLQKAMDEVKQAIAVQPLPLYVQLQGDIFYAMKDYASAITCYDIVNHSELSSAASLYSTSQCMELLGQSGDDILAMLDSCVNTFSKPYTQDAAPYFLARASGRMRYGKARDAVADYDEYYNIVNGQVSDYYYYLHEQAALKAKQYQRGLDDLDKAIEINPQEPIYRAELAALNIRVGRFAEAEEVANQLIALDPNYAEGYRLLGVAQIQLKNNDEGCGNLKKAKEMGDTHSDDMIEKYCK